MTEKRFTAFTDFLGGTQTILDNGERKTLQELLDTMNGLAEENKQLKFELKECREHKLFSRRELEKENEQLKHNNKMLSMKMSEVSTKYRLLKEFSDDTNPNEAVGTVLHELMMITKEYR